ALPHRAHETRRATRQAGVRETARSLYAHLRNRLRPTLQAAGPGGHRPSPSMRGTANDRTTRTEVGLTRNPYLRTYCNAEGRGRGVREASQSSILKRIGATDIGAVIVGSIDTHHTDSYPVRPTTTTRHALITNAPSN